MYNSKSSRIFVLCFILATINHTIMQFEPNNSETVVTKNTPEYNADSNFSEIEILLFAAQGVGNNYFDVRNTLLSWNVSVTTVGPSETVYSCNNRGNSQRIECDLDFREFTLEDFEQYDAVFIPSGGYWSTWTGHSILCQFLLNASSVGLLISSMCVGTTILAGPDGLIEDKYVVGHNNGGTNLRNAGAIQVFNSKNTVIDGNIITGGLGGGFTGGGHSRAPYTIFCANLLRCI